MSSYSTTSNGFKPNSRQIMTGGACFLAMALPVLGEEPFAAGGTAQIPPLPNSGLAALQTGGETNAPPGTATNSIENFFNGKIPGALANGTFNLNVRLRYEQVDE